MSVLVDSSVWIDYFRGTEDPARLDILIEENLVVVNDLVLAEIIPALHMKGRKEIIALMNEIHCPAMNIDWDDIIQMQIICLRHGINRVGIPDLIIAQHTIQNDLEIYSIDKHFKLLAKHLPLAIY